MTAPVATARATPSGRRMGDGQGALITFASDTNIELWEVSVTPPGLDGGDARDTTTGQNATVRTKAPGSLIEWTDSTATVQYDPVVYSAVTALINQPTTITWTFPNSDTLAAYGYLKSFIPGEMAEGDAPTAEVTIVLTNQDPSTCAEEVPVYAAGSGTGVSC